MSKEEMLEVKVCSDDSRIQSREECPEGCLPSDEVLAPIVETDKDLKLNTSIYHYMSVEHFLDMIENKRNVLMHVSYWEDPFEAFLFRGGITAANEDGDDAGELYDAFKFLYGQSWTLTENESDIVWRAMGKRGTVVRIKTTIRKLAASILSQPGLSSGGWSRIKKIKYLKPKEFNRFLTRDMVNSIMKGDNDAREKCLFQKREAFSLENEVRVVVIPNENALDRERCVHGGMLKFNIKPKLFIDSVLADPCMGRREFEQLVCRVRHVSREIEVEPSGLFEWPRIVETGQVANHKLDIDEMPEGQCFYDYLIGRYQIITDNAYCVWRRVLRVFREAKSNGWPLSNHPTMGELTALVIDMDKLIQNKGSADDCKTAIRHYMRALYGHDDRGK